MSTLQEAAAAGTILAKQYKAMLTIGEYLLTVANIDSHAAELIARRDRAVADLVPVKEALDAANLNLTTVRTTAVQVEAKSKADVSAALARVDGIINTAVEKGMALYNAELVKAKVVTDAAAKLNVAALAEVGVLANQKAALTADIKKLTDELAALRKRLVI